MAEVVPFPFATVQDLRDRWPDMPPGSDVHAGVLLEDASQFILDETPTAVDAAEATRRRIVCAVVRRSMEAQSSDLSGLEQFQSTTGPYSLGGRPANPHGDFYLTRSEKRSLGSGKQKAWSVEVGPPSLRSRHLPWCNLNLGANYCSCGADIAGEPIYEGG